MRLLLFLFSIALLLSCSTGKKSLASTTTEQDTVYQTHTEVVKASDLSGVAPEPGQNIEFKTPKLHVKLYRGHDGEVVITHEQPLIRQKTREVHLLPVKIKNKNRTKTVNTHQENSHNEQKIKDSSKEKSPVEVHQGSHNQAIDKSEWIHKVKQGPVKDKSQHASNNRDKDKKTDPLPLLWLLLIVLAIAYTIYRLKRR